MNLAARLLFAPSQLFRCRGIFGYRPYPYWPILINSDEWIAPPMMLLPPV